MKKIMMIVAAAAMSVQVMAADVDAGKAKAAMCGACHGANGIALVPTYPNLAGQNAAYLVSSMKAYKAQQRTGGQAPMMYGMVAALSDADMENLAAYFSSLK